MRILWVLVIIGICISCGGSLTSEQRKKIRENMEAGEIKRVSDAELTAAAFAYARRVADIIEKKPGRTTDRKFLDSLRKSCSSRIFFLEPSDAMLRGVEKALIDAYTSDGTASSLPDNIQKAGADSLLYTKPVMRERPDGSQEFMRAIALMIPKREVVKSIQ
ncbi:MAG: hypothetical protein JST43_00845 [Bacteroidetes bacterium]|nr:hypothetical protein [Bacteroidota bacterium]MBS1540695.1 hypothetical protein [Bacteroidota bacterium]